MEGSNFVVQMGTMFAFVVIFPLWLLVKAIVRTICTGSCRIKCCYNTFIASSPVMPVFVTFMLESCLEIGVASSVSIYFMSDERLSTVWEASSAFLAYVFAVALVCLPIYMIISGVRIYRAVKTKNEEQKARYEELFEGLRL